jgi:hypothetical protein
MTGKLSEDVKKWLVMSFVRNIISYSRDTDPKKRRQEQSAGIGVVGENGDGAMDGE